MKSLYFYEAPRRAVKGDHPPGLGHCAKHANIKNTMSYEVIILL